VVTDNPHYPDGVAEVVIHLVGLEVEPTEATVVGFVVRVQGDEPFAMVEVACDLVADRLKGLGPCQTVKIEFLGDVWSCEVLDDDDLGGDDA
jgi:hypothetical protein